MALPSPTEARPLGRALLASLVAAAPQMTPMATGGPTTAGKKKKGVRPRPGTTPPPTPDAGAAVPGFGAGPVLPVGFGPNKTLSQGYTIPNPIDYAFAQSSDSQFGTTNPYYWATLPPGHFALTTPPIAGPGTKDKDDDGRKAPDFSGFGGGSLLPGGGYFWNLGTQVASAYPGTGASYSPSSTSYSGFKSTTSSPYSLSTTSLPTRTTTAPAPAPAPTAPIPVPEVAPTPPQPAPVPAPAPGFQSGNVYIDQITPATPETMVDQTVFQQQAPGSLTAQQNLGPLEVNAQGVADTTNVFSPFLNTLVNPNDIVGENPQFAGVNLQENPGFAAGLTPQLLAAKWRFMSPSQRLRAIQQAQSQGAGTAEDVLNYLQGFTPGSAAPLITTGF